MSEPIKNRYEFVILFDVENGNPNGDPDAGNMPRVDPETGLGLVTDVCLKRKIRNYVETVKEDAAGYRIYVKDGVPLNRSDAEAYKALDVDEKTAKEKKKADPELDRKIRDWMCANFYDIRAFGAVMTTFMKAALNCGQVRGPVQLGFARSVEPVIPQEITITRVAITTEADAEKKGTEMGRKYIVPYGLYRCEGYISANLARKTTGFSEEDLSLLWEAILNMFENDHSAARGKMAVRELIVFRHDSELGCAPAWKLFDTVKIARKDPADASPARSFGDYTVSVDESALPAGMNLMALFYNKTLLAEAGYTEPPKTMEEMYEMAVNTTKLKPDGTIDVMGYPDFPSVYYTDNFAAALGGGWYDENGKPASPDNEGNLMALKYAVMYREKFGVENVAKFGSAGKYLDPTDPFLAGKQTFRVDGNWLGANINDTFKVDVDYGCTFIPYPEGHEELKGRGIASSSMFYIPSNSKNPDGAYDFLTFICGPEGTMLQSVSHGGFPSLLSQLESDEFVNGSYNSDVFAELAASPNLFALPNVPQSTEYNTIIKEEVELALNLKQTPEQALQNIYDKGSELFK